VKLGTVFLGLGQEILFRCLLKQMQSQRWYERRPLGGRGMPPTARLQTGKSSLRRSQPRMRKSKLRHLGELQIALTRAYQLQNHSGSRKLTVNKYRKVRLSAKQIHTPKGAKWVQMSRLKPSNRIDLALRPGLQALLYGSLVLALLISADEISVHYGLRESQRVIDDLIGALIAGLLIYRNERNRSRLLQEKLQTIELMNHHVRNALQPIMDSAYLQGHAQHIEVIRHSVRRIDWALREILPGHVIDEYEDPAGRAGPGVDSAA